MNAQIRKLIEQAYVWAAENYPESLDDNDQFHALSMERLAELVVRECARLIDAEEIQSRYGDMLKQHFGVEE